MKFEEAFKNIKERFINKDASNIEDIAIQFYMIEQQIYYKKIAGNIFNSLCYSYLPYI